MDCFKVWFVRQQITSICTMLYSSTDRIWVGIFYFLMSPHSNWSITYERTRRALFDFSGNWAENSKVGFNESTKQINAGIVGDGKCFFFPSAIIVIQLNHILDYSTGTNITVTFLYNILTAHSWEWFSFAIGMGGFQGLPRC